MLRCKDRVFRMSGTVEVSDTRIGALSIALSRDGADNWITD